MTRSRLIFGLCFFAGVVISDATSFAGQQIESLAVGDRLLRSAAQGKGRHHAPLGGVDHRAALGLSVEDENALGRRIVNNGVRILFALDPADRLQRLRIENDDLARVSIADESATKLRH